MKATLGNVPRKKLADISNIPQEMRLGSQNDKSQHISIGPKEYIDMLKKVNSLFFWQWYIVLKNGVLNFSLIWPFLGIYLQENIELMKMLADRKYPLFVKELHLLIIVCRQKHIQNLEPMGAKGEVVCVFVCIYRAERFDLLQRWIYSMITAFAVKYL